MTLPMDFCPNQYKNANKDLLELGPSEATWHYLLHGHREKRVYKGKRESVLFFSPQWPYHDRNSGGKRLFELLKILKERYDVFYFVDEEINFTYEEELSKNGINVYCGRKDLKGILLKLKNRGISPRASFFSWWTTGLSYLETTRSIFPEAVMVADTVDVHWLREERGGMCNESRKSMEKNVYNSCDVVIAVTEEDKKEIEQECKHKNVVVVSNIHQEEAKKAGLGKDIIFLGGFNHPPNIIAAKRACEIYKKFIEESQENCNLYIVGDNPPNEVKKLSNNNGVFVTGHVHNLNEYFRRAKIMLAPLTYGAGIKGKICDSVMNKVLVVTTRIGAEGFNFSNFEECFIAEKDSQFVSCLKQIWSLKQSTIEEITKKAFNKISRFVSADSARSTLEKIIEPDKHVVVSIATYKNEEILEECLQSLLLNTEYNNLSVVVTDNAADSRIEGLVQRFKYLGLNVEYTKNENNEFFSRPHNKVMERFKNSDVILLNDDTIIKTKCWIKVIQKSVYASGDIACGGGKALMMNGRLEEAGSIMFNDGYGENIGRDDDPDKEVYNERKFVGYCSGSLLYLKRSSINEIGLLDEDYKPLYFEDTDWQYRAHEKGYKVVYEPGCVYVHRGRSTTRSKLNEYMEGCRKIFIEKHRNFNLESYNHISRWDPTLLSNE